MFTKFPLRNKSGVQAAIFTTATSILIALMLSAAKDNEQCRPPTTISYELSSPLVSLHSSIDGHDWSSDELSGQNSTTGPTFPVCGRLMS